MLFEDNSLWKFWENGYPDFILLFNDTNTGWFVVSNLLEDEQCFEMMIVKVLEPSNPNCIQGIYKKRLTFE